MKIRINSLCELVNYYEDNFFIREIISPEDKANEPRLRAIFQSNSPQISYITSKQDPDTKYNTFQEYKDFADREFNKFQSQEQLNSTLSSKLSCFIHIVFNHTTHILSGNRKNNKFQELVDDFIYLQALANDIIDSGETMIEDNRTTEERLDWLIRRLEVIRTNNTSMFTIVEQVNELMGTFLEHEKPELKNKPNVLESTASDLATLCLEELNKIYANYHDEHPNGSAPDLEVLIYRINLSIKDTVRSLLQKMSLEEALKNGKEKKTEI